MKRTALDWFECSCWLDEGKDLIKTKLREFLNDIRSLLLFDFKQFGFGFYNDGYQYEEIGLSICFSPKISKNAPVYLVMQGKFFQNPDHENLFNDIMAVVRQHCSKFIPTRIDYAVDLVSCFGEIEHFPEPEAKNGSVAAFKHYSDADGNVETIVSGKGDSRLKVYNKLLENPEYIKTYGYSENLPVLEVWRIEYTVRGQTLKNIVKHLPDRLFQTGIYCCMMGIASGQMFRRYTFPCGLFGKEIASDISGREAVEAMLENQIIYRKRKIAKLEAENQYLEIMRHRESLERPRFPSQYENKVALKQSIASEKYLNLVVETDLEE